MKPERLCSIVDGLLVLAAFFALAAVQGFNPQTFGLLLSLALPVAMLAAWRGRVHAVQLIAGQRSWIRPAVEGFVWGFVFPAVFDGLHMIKDAAASGPTYPDFGAPADVWFTYLKYLLPFCSFFGAAGALLAVALSATNRGIIKWVAR